MQCTAPITIKLKNRWVDAPNHFNKENMAELIVPCGKCLACKISKVREWSVRMLHELSSHEDSSFITLTYQNEFLPENGSLKKTHLQLFFKRLRKAIHPKKIRYYAVGEYGDITMRPHYHIILFGLGLRVEDKKCVMDAWPYTNWSIDSIRSKAFGLVEPDSIQYVAKYVHKQYSGQKRLMNIHQQGVKRHLG